MSHRGKKSQQEGTAGDRWSEQGKKTRLEQERRLWQITIAEEQVHNEVEDKRENDHNEDIDSIIREGRNKNKEKKKKNDATLQEKLRQEEKKLEKKKEDTETTEQEEQQRIHEKEKEDKCPICKKNVKRQGVLCGECERWYHYRCEKTKKEEVEEIYKQREYVCKECRTQAGEINKNKDTTNEDEDEKQLEEIRREEERMEIKELVKGIIMETDENSMENNSEEEEEEGEDVETETCQKQKESDRKEELWKQNVEMQEEEEKIVLSRKRMEELMTKNENQKKELWNAKIETQEEKIKNKLSMERIDELTTINENQKRELENKTKEIKTTKNKNVNLKKEIQSYIERIQEIKEEELVTKKSSKKQNNNYRK